MRHRSYIFVLRFGIASVWMANGLYCKLLGLVPRHQAIVGAILGEEHALQLTRLIGFAEIGMAVWILSGIAPRLSVGVQVAVVATMNILEFLLVPELLLWGRFNSLFALVFILLIIAVEYYRTRPIRSHVVS